MTAYQKKKLNDWAIGTVKTMLRKSGAAEYAKDSIAKVTVREYKDRGHALDYRGAIRIELTGPVDFYGLRSIMEAIEPLGHTSPELDETCLKTIGGIDFAIGDGDDGSATYLENNAICVWLRGWPTASRLSPMT